MSDARWIEVEADMAAAALHFGNAVGLWRAGGFDLEGLDGYRAEMALMHALQSAHTSFESGLVRILEMLGEERPVGENWHAALIRRVAMGIDATRPPILGPDIVDAAQTTRRFRHRAAHNYDSFEIREVGPVIEAAEKLAARLIVEVRRFRDKIDPPDAGR